jgi:hypothetical protein
MSFVSVTFWALFLIFLPLWFLLPWKSAKGLALRFSLFFYGWWDFRYLFLILIVSVITHDSSHLVERGASRFRAFLADDIKGKLNSTK